MAVGRGVNERSVWAPSVSRISIGGWKDCRPSSGGSAPGRGLLWFYSELPLCVYRLPAWRATVSFSGMQQGVETC